MRQTVRSAGLLSLFLLNLATLNAEPVLRGFFIEKLPAESANPKMSSEKSLVLAHVLNSGEKAMTPGNYQVGLEISTEGKKKSFALKPDAQIAAGALKTFRMAVPVTATDKTSGSFRIFSRIDGKMIWSEKVSFLQGVHKTDNNKVTTLYTEAPPEPDQVHPPTEVPFEDAKSARQAAALEKSVAAKMPVTKPATIKTAEKTAKADPGNVAPAKTRKIDSSEFKTLRTIDEELVIYVIKDGDSLRSIAEKYYGQASRERAIADLNFIEKTSAIKVGEEIIVDVKPLARNQSVSKTIKNSSIGESFLEGKRTYTIQSGDTLSKIAQQQLGNIRHVDRILKANPGLNKHHLKVGEAIVIPQTKGDNA